MDTTTIPEIPPGGPRPPRRDSERYRLGQRRRAIIGWSVGFFVVVMIGLTIAFGVEVKTSETSSPTPVLSPISYEMTSVQYNEIREGEGESLVLNRLGNTGLQEDEAEASGVPQLFPAPPSGSACSFWKLSDAPGHLVRLCFSEPQGVLLQKSVRAPGEGGAQTTLA